MIQYNLNLFPLKTKFEFILIKLTLTLVILGHLATAFGQEKSGLLSLPPGQTLTDTLSLKKLGFNGSLFSYSTFSVEKKWNNPTDSSTVLLIHESTSVCLFKYLISMTSDETVIDARQIEESCDQENYNLPYCIFTAEPIEDRIVLFRGFSFAIFDRINKIDYELVYSDTTFIPLSFKGYFFEIHRNYLNKSTRLCPESSKTILSDSFILKLTVDERDILRNEIFASHGHRFVTPKWKAYFSLQPWYQPTGTVGLNQLSLIEIENINRIDKILLK